ncbi:MAG: hypothetical protein RL750_793 [Bacteroidota bacterium]
MKKTILLLTFLSVLVGLTQAQNNVWLYEGCNYTGIGHTLGVGQYRLYQMKIGNDRLQGIQIPNGLKVTIYENDNFQGKSKTYFSNQPCLEPEFRNMASSIIVENAYGQPGNNSNDYVTFFNDCTYRGYSQSFSPGIYSGSQLGQLKFNISSLRIQGDLVVKAFLNNEYNSGVAITLDNSSPCLPAQYNDKIGSFAIEYRNNNNNNNNNNNGGNRPRSYATVYSECQYAGNALRLQPGYYDGSKLGLLKFSIQSIELPQNLRIKAYLNTENLTGFSQTISQSSPCLSSQFSNRIGALVIEEVNTGWGNNNGGGWGNNGGGGSYGNQPVILYEDNDYRGQSISLTPGTYANLSSMGFQNQALSSIQIPAGYRVVLYDQLNLRGASYTLTSSRMSLNLIGWNDRAVSMAIYRE